MVFVSGFRRRAAVAAPLTLTLSPRRGEREPGALLPEVWHGR
jgi:hypothetical protein